MIGPHARPLRHPPSRARGQGKTHARNTHTQPIAFACVRLSRRRGGGRHIKSSRISNPRDGFACVRFGRCVIPFTPTPQPVTKLKSGFSIITSSLVRSLAHLPDLTKLHPYRSTISPGARPSPTQLMDLHTAHSTQSDEMRECVRARVRVRVCVYDVGSTLP